METKEGTMRNRLEERLGRPLTTALMAGILVFAMAGSAAAALTIAQIWDGIRPKADARYLQNTKVFATDRVLIGTTSGETIIRNCPKGWQALGGGGDPVSQNTNDLDVVYNGPMVDGDNLVAADPGKNPPATGWKVRVVNNNGSVSYEVVVGVICSP